MTDQPPTDVGNTPPRFDSESFLSAARTGSIEGLQHCMTVALPSQDARDAALVAAAGSGQLPTVKYLHEIGAAIDAHDHAAIIAAAQSGQSDVVRYLHQMGADIFARGNEPTRAAIRAGRVEVLRYLHQQGALDAQAEIALREAARHGQVDVVRYLHENGADLAASGPTALVLASEAGQLDAVRYLHSNGMDLAAAGPAALIRASAAGHLDIVRYLHRNGVDVRAGGAPALAAALKAERIEVVEYLRRSGCAEPGDDPDSSQPQLSDEDRLPSGMVLPVATGDLARVRLLYENGVLGDGVEASVLAASNGQLAVVEYLHQWGCPFETSAVMALPAAAANGRLNVVQYLHEKGCDFAASGQEAMLAAAAKGHADVVKYLHSNGVPIDICESIVRSNVGSKNHADVVRYAAQCGVFPAGPALAELIDAIDAIDPTRVRTAAQAIDIASSSELLVDALTRHGNVALCAQLRTHGLDIRCKNDLALRMAAERGHLDMVRMLHQSGADIRSHGGEAMRNASTSGHLAIVEYLCTSGAELAAIDPTTLDLIRVNGHFEVYDFLTRSGVDAIAEDRPQIQAMYDELKSAAAVYWPSKLWEFFNEVNMEQLRRGGMHFFKRSINQNYFNFIPYSPLDPQLRQLTLWWLRHPSLTPLKLQLVDPDRIEGTNRYVRVDLRMFTLARGQSLISRLSKKIDADFARVALVALYRGLLATLWDFVRGHDKFKLVDTLAEPRLGSPVAAYFRRRMISQDLAHSIMEFNSIIGDLPPMRGMRIAEVGAGYGRLAYVIARQTDCRYVVIDIPPGLYVSQWYLSKLFPGKRIFKFRPFARFEDIAEEFEQADIAFLCANQIERLPRGYFDLTINISSLHELRPDQIEHMLAHIFRITRKYVYLKQYKEYVNPYDGIRIFEDSYKLAPGWKYRYYKDDPVDPRFFETMIESEEANRAAEPEPAAALPTPAPARPSVSILLANFNHSEYLPTSLGGLCGQTHPADEIIIVDDGSTDRSVEIIREFAQRHPNIRLLENGRNRGQHYSIQRALAAASGEYVAWASSDDLLLPRFLERSLDAIREHPGVGLCFSRLAVFVDGTTETREFTEASHGAAFDYGRKPRHLSPQDLDATLVKNYLWISGNTVVARRDALLEMGGFEKHLKWHADWFGFYAVALRYGACMIPETLALMRERPGTYSGGGTSDSTQQKAVLTGLFDTVKSSKYLDIGPVFRKRPTLLSLFGKRALFAAMAAPRHWDIAWSIGRWLAPRYAYIVYGRTRAWLAARRSRVPRQ